MIKYFIVVDCSGSAVSDDTSMVGMINDVTRDLISEIDSYNGVDVRVICYANDAKVYWKSSNGHGFLDLPETAFGERSNLGKAYELIEKLVKTEKVALKDCAIALISDGESTDDYKKALSSLDEKDESFRVAISFGNYHYTTERHGVKDDRVFTKGVEDRDDFIEKAVEILSK